MTHGDSAILLRDDSTLAMEGVVPMTLDERISVASKLIAQREQIDYQLNALFGGSVISKKQPRCSHCGKEGHNAKTCLDKLPQQNEQAEPPE